MRIHITDKRKISAIQKEFSELFPYLKIEFFIKSHKIYGVSSKKSIRPVFSTIGECSSTHKSGSLSISPMTTVAELEQNFKNAFGLSAQIFRKSGKAWLETTVTDGWTLDKQNKQGEALSNYLMSRESRGEYEAAE